MIPMKEEWMAALAARHGAMLQSRFSSATVAICGLGGLGSNIAIALGRAGIGKLILIDFDRVDLSNLHRQQYRATQIGRYKTEALAENLREIAPYTEIETITERITEDNARSLLTGADIVCEAFDDAQAKATNKAEKAALALYGTIPVSTPPSYYATKTGLANYGSAGFAGSLPQDIGWQK